MLSSRIEICSWDFSLRALDGFIQPICTKGLTASFCKSDEMD